ncbi:RNA 2'-phosphotransferase [compost metagenome]
MSLDFKGEQKLSKFFSLILRHQSEKFGINLDPEGYCTISSLISSVNSQPQWGHVDKFDIEQVVKNCSKQRYEINGDLIRARYGHSSEKIEYEEKIPPSILYHGTNSKVSNLILSTGIKPMNRKYVHLSESTEFATLAGQRRGQLVMIRVNTTKAVNDGVKFYYAGNEVWLSEFIDSKYLEM